MLTFITKNMNSLRVKLIMPFLIGTLILTASLAWYTYTAAKQEVVDAMLSISEAKTNHAVSSMSLLFKSLSTVLYNMVVDTHVISLFDQAIPLEKAISNTNEWINIVASSNEYYRDIYIVNHLGECVVSSNPSYVGRNFIAEPYVKSALNGQFELGEAAVGRVTKKLTVTMAGPIDIGAEVAGALIIITDFPNIVDYGQKTTYDSQTIFTSLLTPEGMFAAHIDNGLMGNKNKLFPQIYNDLKKAREHGEPIQYSLAGKTYVGYAKLEPTTQWIVLTSGKESEVLASAYYMGLTVMVISTLFLVIATIMVVRFTTGVLNSMFSLINYAKAVSEGDLDSKLEATHRTDELGTLHLALQRLVVTLKNLLQEARNASVMKGQFLANMSHEIRTPLNAIIGMTHLMRRDPNLSGQLKMYVEKTLASSRLLLGLINDILDLSKVDAGMIELEQLPLDLHEVLLNAISMHQENAEGKGLYLKLEYLLPASQRVAGDALRIGQVVNNLLSNALKFTKEGGITITCAELNSAQQNQLNQVADQTSLPQADQDTLVQATPAQGMQSVPKITLQITIADTGIGIAESAQEKLFQPFTQADASITRQFGGTGLGLTISNSLVKLMGGTLTIVSQPTIGTIASFTMQMELLADVEPRTSSASISEAESYTYQLKGKTILLAEDNLINQLIVEELLTPLGAEVVIANNGQEAVKAVKLRTFDLIFMDMQMPIMDGLEATRQIRLLDNGKKIPIIALTANAMKEDKALCFACGMNAYLTKPIEPPVLISVIREYL